MSTLVKLALVLFLACVILNDCDAVAKAKSRRNHRNRCPSACVRKIRQFEKKGPPGPPGERGPPGSPGPRGASGSLKLPACKFGEYLTSDGTSLRCEKLNIDGVCSSLRKECPSNDKDPSTGNGGSSSNVQGKMVKFMKKNMFQTISTDAWDVETFEVDGSLFFGLSQLGQASFQIYKWNRNSFKKLDQKFKVMNARNWAPFMIGNDLYFAVASYIGNVCPIFRYDKVEEKFVNLSKGLECKQAFDLKPFKMNGEQHIVVANPKGNEAVVVWKWNGKYFIKLQEIPITATYVEAFDVNGDAFIAISGSDGKGPYVFLYKWNGAKFVSSQSLFTDDRPYEMAAFKAGRKDFISVATMGTSQTNGARDPNKLLLFKWNGNEFESFQNITSYGARRVTAISSLLMGKETTYLAVINYFRKPEIYYWVGDTSTKFDKLQEINTSSARDASSARDVSFFEMGQNMYLLLTSRNSIDVFRGELV